MNTPQNILDAIRAREQIDTERFVSIVGKKQWSSIKDELQEAMGSAVRGIQKACKVLGGAEVPEGVFPKMHDGSHAFMPFLRPLPKKGGFIQCMIPDIGAPIQIAVRLERPTVVQFVANLSPVTGGLVAIQLHHMEKDGLTTNCTWEKRPNKPQTSFQYLQWSRPGNSKRFSWARGVGQTAMPDGAKSRAWAVQDLMPSGHPVLVNGKVSK